MTRFSRASSSRARLLVAAALVGAGLVLGSPATEPVRAYPASTVDLTGHGWGHGRGMGQFGAQGYAVNHGWSYTQILDHFYGGTTMGAVGNDVLSVHITRKDNVGVIVLHSAQADNAVRFDPIAPNTYQRYDGPNCGGPWSATGAPQPGPITLTPDGGTALALCDAGPATAYGGTFRIEEQGGSKLINFVDTETYVRGVVPKESPSSFHPQALRAQAVAARSYARASNRPAGSAYNQCDTTQCQVYGGISAETGPTNEAVNATVGQVRRHKSNNAVASTEFSSSTGGWTAGGTFPAVEDLGDSIASNPNHTWTAKVPVSAVQAAYPEIGTLLAVSVTKRNGLGDFGGRVQQVVLRGTAGSRTITGGTFRDTFDVNGVKSDWFLVTNSESGGVDGYWIVGPDGGIFSFGNAQFHGSTGAIRLNRPIVGMAATPSGKGYWLVASDGGIFAFGDAAFYGSTGAIRLNQPVVGMASTPSGRGYWLVAADGGIFAFGDAQFHGSTGAIRLNQPIVAMAATDNGFGYWLLARDGGLFAFGNAGFHGSLPGIRAPGPAVDMRATSTGGGYEIVTSAGRVYPFGDAPYFGDIATGLPGYRGGVEGIDLHRTKP